MTTLLTRLYADEKIAKAVCERLYRAGFPRFTMRVVSAKPNETRESLMARMERAMIPERAASVYTEGASSGNAVLVVAASFKPLNARRIGLGILSDSDDLPTNLESQDFKIGRIKDHAPSVMKDHPRFFTPSPDPDYVGGPWSDQFGFRLLSAPRQRNSAIKDGGNIMPFGTLMTNRKANSANSGGSYMSRLFWPMKLITKNNRRSSVIRGGGQPLSRLLGWRTTS